MTTTVATAINSAARPTCGNFLAWGFPAEQFEFDVEVFRHFQYHS